MPFLNMKVSGCQDDKLSQKINTLLLKHTSEILKKVPELTAITIEYLPQENWFVGGKSLAETGKHSFNLTIKITDETNSKAEKAQYIAAVFSEMAALLGKVHDESYIHIQDIRASAYGYAGKTQEYRYHIK